MTNTTLYKMSLIASSAIGLCAAAPAFAAANPVEGAAPAAVEGQAPAAANNQTQPGEGGDVIVTARRVEERLRDVPISITVFNQQQLDNRNIVSATDLATYTPSLSANNRYGPESSQFSIRGFVQEGQTSPSVAVYFGEVVGPRVQGGTPSGNGAGVGSLFDLQNVQVLKGPQGTLFGRNTTGGAVLLVPQKPTSKFEGYVEGSYGNYDMKRIQGVINIPISENIRIRAGVDHMDRIGYLNNISGIGPKDFMDVNYTAARLSAVIDITPDIENYTIGTYSISTTNGTLPKLVNLDNGGLFANNPATRDPFPQLRIAQLARTAGNYYNVENGLPEAFQRIRQWQVINNTTFNLSDSVTLKNIVSYVQFRQDQASMIYGENPYEGGTTVPFAAINIVPQPGTHNASQQTFTEEFRLQYTSDRLTAQAGVYYEKSDPLGGFQGSYSANNLACTNVRAFLCQNAINTGNGPRFVAGTPIQGFIQNSRSQYRFENLGVFAQATYKITDQFSVTGGIRWTRDTVKGVGQVFKIFFDTPNTARFACSQPNTALDSGPTATTPAAIDAQVRANPNLCNLTRNVKSQKPTWLVDLDFKPIDDLLVYAKYARGYRQGGTNVSSYGLETWDPEQVDNFEVGVKYAFNIGFPVTVDLAGFYNAFANQQIAINTISCANIPTFPTCAGVPTSAYPSPAQGIGNGAKSTIQGIEFETNLKPFAGFNLNFAYAYLDTRLGGTGVYPNVAYGFALYQPNAVVGGPLQQSPRNKYTLTGTYVLPLDQSVGRVSFSATYTHQDSSLGNASSLPAMRILPPQNNLNLNLNWYGIAGSPVDLALFMTNATGEKNYNYNIGSSFGWDSVIISEPRMFGARVKFHFGS